MAKGTGIEADALTGRTRKKAPKTAHTGQKSQTLFPLFCCFSGVATSSFPGLHMQAGLCRSADCERREREQRPLVLWGLLPVFAFLHRPALFSLSTAKQMFSSLISFAYRNLRCYR